jgi:hypothetical protein
MFELANKTALVLGLDAALEPALWAAPGGRGGPPNVVLIAGGRDEGHEFRDLSPLLSQQVKRAFVTGSASDKSRAAWSLFTPCTPVASLLEAVQRSAATAVPGDVVLLSPACPSHDSQEGSHDRGEAFRQAVAALPRGGRERDGHASPGVGDADVRILERLTENRTLAGGAADARGAILTALQPHRQPSL